MGERLKGKVAVVTGAGGGIGRGIALAMAAEGAKVVVNDLGGAANGTGASATPAQSVVNEIKSAGGEAVANYDSVATAEGGSNIVNAAVENFGRIDILVNVAGITRDRMVWNMSDEEFDAVIKVHLYGTFYTTRAAAKLMREQRSGRIINTTSNSGLFGNAGQANYSSAKGGIVGMTKSCALALGRYGITVNAVAPMAATRMTMAMPEDKLRELMKVRYPGADVDSMTVQQIYDKVMGRPEDVASIYVYLATDAAANINGQVFHATGGKIVLYSAYNEWRTIFKDGHWEMDELDTLVPGTLASGLVNPAPPESK